MPKTIPTPPRKAIKPTNQQLAKHSWLSVVRAYNLCDAVLTQRLAGMGLKLAEHEVLINLLRTPRLSQQQLAKRCFVAKSGVSMLVTRMQKDGLVQRHADAVDARVWLLALTPRGRVLAEQAQAIQDGVVQVMARHSSAQELQGIADAMQRIGAALEALLDVGAAPRG
jgi:DNA-binding MarR family transcriptional regulator